MFSFSNLNSHRQKFEVALLRAGSSTSSLERGSGGAGDPKVAGNWKYFVGYMYKYAAVSYTHLTLPTILRV